MNAFKYILCVDMYFFITRKAKYHTVGTVPKSKCKIVENKEKNIMILNALKCEHNSESIHILAKT